MIVIGGGLAQLGHVLLAEIRSVGLPAVAAAGHRQPAGRAVRAGRAGPASPAPPCWPATRRLRAGVMTTPRRTVVLRLTDVVKTFPGVRALDGVQLEVRGRRGALPARPERRRQVHPDQGAGRGAPRRRRGDQLAGRSRSRRPPRRPRCAPASPPSTRSSTWSTTCRSPRTRSSATSRAGPGSLRRRSTADRTREILARLGHARDPAAAAGARAAGGRQADRQHGAGAVARRPADRHGRAQRRARPRRGGEPVPDHPGADRAGHRGHLHLAPARGDPRDRRPGHGAQGRPHHRGQPAGPHHPDPRAGRPDDRPHHRVRVPAAHRQRPSARAAAGRRRA